MSQPANNKPPLLALAFFRWFCHPDLQEGIEGDLLERYYKCSEQFGTTKANTIFHKEVLLLFRPSIIGNIHHLTFNLFLDMKTWNWIQLIALNVLVVLCIFLPFLPGPYDKLSLVISGIAQLTGYVGLLLVPIGILWLIQELRKSAGNVKTLTLWSSGYYYAITATVICTFLSLFFALALLMEVGISASLIALIFIGFMLNRQISAIKVLKYNFLPSFNVAPLYLLSIPIIAFIVCSFLISPVSEYSRNYAMKQGLEAIAAIENYHHQTGSYPASIEYVPNVPKPSIMGTDKFIYELNGDAYNLAFVQHQHLGATREVVMYNKNDQHNVKGHFANYNTNQPHWKYYWLD